MSYQVSVIIPVYNGARLLRRSIESVLRQTRPVAEILVIDDGSTDRTCEIVRSYGAPVRLISQQNAGAAAARNHGAREATAEWLAFLDHDDEWLPNKLELQLGALENMPDARLCYGPFWLFGLKGSVTKVFTPLRDVRERARVGNPFPPSVVVVRRAEYLELGGFRGPQNQLRGLGAFCPVCRPFSRHGDHRDHAELLRNAGQQQSQRSFWYAQECAHHRGRIFAAGHIRYYEGHMAAEDQSLHL